MDSILSALGLKHTIVQGACAGGVVSLILSEGPWLRRAFRAAGGVLSALYATEFMVDLTARWIAVTPATERFGGLVFGLIGIYAAEGLIRAAAHMRDRSAGLADKALKKATGL